MIVYTIEDNQVVEKELTDTQKSSVIGTISQKWLTWSELLVNMRKNRDVLVDRVKPKVCKVKRDDNGDEDWHSNIELNRPYQYFSKLYGMLYETFYDKISSYVKMPKDIYDRVASRALNIDNKKEILASLNDMLEYGEIVASAEKRETYTKDVFPIESIADFDPNDIISVQADSFKARIKTGEEIKYVRINPVDFAYDPLVTPGTQEFDECDKIVKQWLTKQQILQNKSFEITKDELNMIIGDVAAPNQRSQDVEDKDVVYRYNQVEVLTYYGTFEIDGQYYNDYVAVVIGRKKLVYFAPRNLNTPGIYYYPYHAVGNGARGTSPLFYILDLCRLEQKTLNDSVDFLELQKNKPCYAPAGFFEQEVTKIKPGMHITYKIGMQDPTAIIPIEFNAQPLMVYEAATAQLTEEIAGIDNGKLSEKSEALTEAEIKRIAVNENLVPNMIISGIMLNIISKYLTDCVQLLTEQKVEETVVKTAWEYANEQLQMQNIVDTLQKIAQADPTMVNYQNAAIKVFESMGVNPAEYLNDGRAQKIIQGFSQLSDEVLQELVQQGNLLQVEQNNQVKASKMMGQIQDDLYRSTLRENWKNNGVLPDAVEVPNGQGSIVVPVAPVTPGTQVKNKASVTAD